MASTGTEPNVIVRFTGVTKRYGATQALKGIDLEIESGRIHALVGENGAGKSTALGVLAGRVRPSAGRVELQGQEIPYGAPHALRDAGVLAVYQELTIAPLLSVEANLFLGQPLSRAGALRQRAMAKRYLEVYRGIGVEPSRPGTIAGRLSVAEQQLLEIMRVFVSDCRVILLDEPTASLAIHEREAVFRVLRQLRDNGMAIVIVSHNLDEVLDLADTVTVFREGNRVKSQQTSSWSKTSMVKAMLGDKADDRLREELVPAAPSEAPNPLPRSQDATPDGRRGEPLLRVAQLTVPKAISDIELEVGRGEILGIAGLVGSGRSTVLRALYGLEPTATGHMWVDGEPITPAEVSAAGQEAGHCTASGGSKDRGPRSRDAGHGQHRAGRSQGRRTPRHADAPRGSAACSSSRKTGGLQRGSTGDTCDEPLGRKPAEAVTRPLAARATKGAPR